MKVSIVWERDRIEIVADVRTVGTIWFDDVLDEVEYRDIEDHFPDLHDDCHNADDCGIDAREIVDQVRQCLPDESAFAYHVDNGHPGPLAWCEDLGCDVLSGIEDTLDYIVSHN